MRRRVSFKNIRALPNDRERDKVKSAFQSFLKRNGIHGESTMNGVSGEIFAITERGKIAGGVWIRRWPASPSLGDIHIAASKFRFRDYDTLLAFDLFLIERERVMAFKRWRVIIGAQDEHVLKALKLIRFHEVSRQSFPVIGDSVVLHRERIT